MNLNLSFWRDDPIVRRIETNISGFPSSATAPPVIMEMIKRGNNGDEEEDDLDEDEEKEKKQKDKEEERKMKDEERMAPVIMEMTINQEWKENKD